MMLGKRKNFKNEKKKEEFARARNGQERQRLQVHRTRRNITNARYQSMEGSVRKEEMKEGDA